MLTLLAVKHKIYYLNLHKLAKYEVTTKWKITGLLCPLKPPESNDKSIKTFKKIVSRISENRNVHRLLINRQKNLPGQNGQSKYLTSGNWLKLVNPHKIYPECSFSKIVKVVICLDDHVCGDVSGLCNYMIQNHMISN